MKSLFNSIFALVSSGFLFHPMTLAGIAQAVIVYFAMMENFSQFFSLVMFSPINLFFSIFFGMNYSLCFRPIFARKTHFLVLETLLQGVFFTIHCYAVEVCIYSFIYTTFMFGV